MCVLSTRIAGSPTRVYLPMQQAFIKCLLGARHCGGDSDEWAQAVPESSRIHRQLIVNSNLA